MYVLGAFADENNAALRQLDALKKSLGRADKKAEDAMEAKERLQQELADAAAAKERLQREASDREEQLATVAAAREKEVAEKLMAAAKAVSGECVCMSLVFSAELPPCPYSIPSLSFSCSRCL